MDPSRRSFLQALGAMVAAGTQRSSGHAMVPDAFVQPAVNVTEATVNLWRSHFAALAQQVNGHPLVYLDTAATALRPTAVTKAITEYYETDNANPGHGGTLHTLARRSGERYEEARQIVATLINAADPAEVVWTRGTTEAINLAASAWGGANLKSDDEIILTITEHYSNLLPWQAVARQTGARLRFVDIDDDGRLRLAELDRLLSKRTKLVAFSHVSNVLGIVYPAKQICQRAHEVGAMVLIDGAQSAPHIDIDVQALGCDFYAFSSHKMLGPMGTGVLWARRNILDEMPPYQTGANMAHDADLQSARYSEIPFKFQAGTAHVSGPVGLAAAIRFVNNIGRQALWNHEQALTSHALDRLAGIKGLRILGTPATSDRISLVAFAIDGVPASDVVKGLDAQGIAVRGGDMAALPLLKRLGLTSAVRASMSLYNTTGEIDRCADALEALLRSRG